MRHSSTRVISSAHTRAKKKEPETPCSGLIFSLFLCQERGLCCSLFLPFCFLCTFFLLGDSVNVAHFRLISFEFQCNYTEATHGSGPSAAAMEVFFFLLPIRLRRSVFSARGCCRSLSFIRRRWFAESFRVWIVRDFVDWFHPLKKGKFIFTFASLHLPFLLCCLFRSTISLQHLFLLLRPPFPCFLCSFFSLLRKKVDSYRVPFDFGTRSNYIRELSDIVQATSG